MDAEAVLGIKIATSVQALKSKIFDILVYAAKQCHTEYLYLSTDLRVLVLYLNTDIMSD